MKTKGALCLAIGVLLFAIGGPVLTEKVQPVTMLPTLAEWSETVEAVFDQEAYEAAMVAQYWGEVESGRGWFGKVSLYAEQYHGFSTYSGVPFDMHNQEMAASNCFSVHSRLRVWNRKELETFNSRGPSPFKMFIDVTISDRGGGLACAGKWLEQPDAALMASGELDRLILVDLSLAGFTSLAPRSRGVIDVFVEVLP